MRITNEIAPQENDKMYYVLDTPASQTSFGVKFRYTCLKHINVLAINTWTSFAENIC